MANKSPIHGESVNRGKPDDVSRFFAGADLYGDDLDEAALKVWYEQEEHGYYNLTASYEKYEYNRHALNHFHAWRFLTGRTFRCCLALGCARGDDVSPLAPIVREFVALETAEQWWKEEICGTPAKYLKPQVTGDIILDDCCVDLAVSLDVLHHIPNVSHVVAEIARVLCPGGLFVLNEPISSMGDWRKPRTGGTANERGLPVPWLENLLQRLSLRIVRRSFIMFRPLARIAGSVGFGDCYNNAAFVRLDALASQVLRWNNHYHRDTIWKKIAPGSVFYVLEKM